MTPERWARIEEVFGEALERPPDTRAAFVREACAGDEQLRQDVERLLAQERKDSFRSPVGAAVVPGLAAGDMLAHYRIEARAGEGGMGTIYRGHDTRLHRKVALKVLPPKTFADPDSKRRLVQEARAASALNHPNIVTIHEIGSDRGVDFIAMELVSGHTLAHLIGRAGLPLEEALRHAVQIAGALAAAHRAGIVHRDLKPANIMVNDHGRVKVLDFGLAKRTGEPAGAEAGSTHTAGPETDTGTILGSAAYMSPEQAEGKKLDARSDIFSFGAVLYEMVTGRRAFERDSTAATLAAILKEEPMPPGTLAGKLPAQLEVILARCLRKDPARRFQHMEDLEVALEKLREARPSKPKRFRKAAWAAGVALLLAAGGRAVWMLRFGAADQDATLVPVPLTSYPGAESQPSFSPDGAQVAFRWCPEDPGKPCQIYIKQVGVEPPSPLTDNPASSDSPAWSPDGQTIAVCRQVSRTREAVILIPQRGGRERVLAEFDELEAKRSVLNGPYLAWTPDSQWLVSPVCECCNSGRQRCSLFMFSAETGEKRRLTAPSEGGVMDTTPAVSPDGRTLVFSRGKNTRFDFYRLRLAKGYVPQAEPERLSPGNPNCFGAAWTPDGGEIVFASGRRGLWRMAVSNGARPRSLPFAPHYAFSPSLSRQGSRLAYSVSAFDNNIWRIDLGAAGHKHGVPMKFVASTQFDYHPAYSPDGTKIAFGSTRSGELAIWVCDSDGSNATQLTSPGGPEPSAPQWSPGGESIAFWSSHGGNPGIYVIGVTGGAPHRLTTHSADRWPSWSRDGKWIYFTSDRDAPVGIWKAPVSGGEAVRVTRGEGDVARESPDGKWLYFNKGYPPPQSLWKMPAGGGQEVEVLRAQFDWTIGKEGVYFISPRDRQGRSNICLREFATGKIRTIGTTDRPVASGMAASPDGRTLLYTQFDSAGYDLMLVEKFR